MAPFPDQPAGLKGTFHVNSPYFHKAGKASKYLSNFKWLINARAMKILRLGFSTAELPGLYGDNRSKSTRSLACRTGKTAQFSDLFAQSHRL